MKALSDGGEGEEAAEEAAAGGDGGRRSSRSTRFQGTHRNEVPYSASCCCTPHPLPATAFHFTLQPPCMASPFQVYRYDDSELRI